MGKGRCGGKSGRRTVVPVAAGRIVVTAGRRLKGSHNQKIDIFAQSRCPPPAFSSERRVVGAECQAGPEHRDSHSRLPHDFARCGRAYRSGGYAVRRTTGWSIKSTCRAVG